MFSLTQVIIHDWTNQTDKKPCIILTIWCWFHWGNLHKAWKERRVFENKKRSLCSQIGKQRVHHACVLCIGGNSVKWTPLIKTGWTSSVPMLQCSPAMIFWNAFLWSKYVCIWNGGADVWSNWKLFWRVKENPYKTALYMTSWALRLYHYHYSP